MTTHFSTKLFSGTSLTRKKEGSLQLMNNVGFVSSTLQDLSPTYKRNQAPKTRYPSVAGEAPLPVPQEALASRVLNSSLSDGDAYTKRCMNCNQYYHEADNTSRACAYHPGVLKDVYTSQTISGGIKKKWSCCGREGFSEDKGGCAVGRHKEDKRTSAILRNFETTLATTPLPANFQRPIVPELRVIQPQEIPKEEQETDLFKRGRDGKLYFKYRINTTTDTLSGVAVKHGITKKKLKEINGLWDDTEFYGRSFVLVPWDESKPVPDQSEAIRAEAEAKKRNLVRKFAQAYQVTTEEAFWYLDDNDYNYELAVESRVADLEWEKSNKGKGIGTKK